MPTNWDDMEKAEVEPYWARFTEDGYVLEHEDEQVAERDGPLVGVVTDITEDAGQNNDSRVYTVRTEVDPRPVMFWGKAHVDNQVDTVGIGVGDEMGIKKTGETRDVGEDNEMDLFEVRYVPEE